MNTVILIHKAGSAGYSDEAIRSSVEQAGSSTLLVDGEIGIAGLASSSANIIRAGLQSFETRERSAATFAAWDRSYLTADAVWVLDARGMAKGKVARSLRHLRSQIFHLSEPPRALVLESSSETHVDVQRTLRETYGFADRREKFLKRAVMRTWWGAILLRLFGLRSFRKTRPLAKLLARLG